MSQNGYGDIAFVDTSQKICNHKEEEEKAEEWLPEAVFLIGDDGRERGAQGWLLEALVLIGDDR